MGTLVLGGDTLGAGLLAGGFILSTKGDKALEEANTLLEEVLENEKKANGICEFLDELCYASMIYIMSLKKVEKIYRSYINDLEHMMHVKTDRNYFTEHEKFITENAVLLVQLLYSTCKVSMVHKSEGPKHKQTVNNVNTDEVEKRIYESGKILADHNIATILNTNTEWATSTMVR